MMKVIQFLVTSEAGGHTTPQIAYTRTQTANMIRWARRTRGVTLVRSPDGYVAFTDTMILRANVHIVRC